MEKKTFAEIIAKLEELEIESYHLGHEDYDENALTEALGEAEEVHSVGGPEGGGEYAERVILFKDHGVYIRITGYYASEDGTEWDGDFEEVFPRKVINTVYESTEERGDKKDEA